MADDPLNEFDLGEEPGKSHYFQGGGFFEKSLRFLNLLEPGHMVLSLTKLGMWVTTAAMVVILTTMPENVTALLGSVGGFSGSLAGYSFRRYMQYSNGQSPYPVASDPGVEPDEDAGRGDGDI